jgi:hypothetical protein
VATDYLDREVERLRKAVHELGKELWALRLVVAEIKAKQKEERALRLTLFQEAIAVITVVAVIASLVLQVLTR